MAQLVSLVPKFSKRIYEDFCPDCKYRRKCQDKGLLFEPNNSVCKTFEWISDARKEAYYREVRESQAQTEWLMRGKTLQEIKEMSATARLSVLNKKSKAVEKPKPAPVPAPVVPKVHYFYCNKEGKEVVYERNTTTKSYESEVVAFRKYLAKQGIVINKEEIK